MSRLTEDVRQMELTTIQEKLSYDLAAKLEKTEVEMAATIKRAERAEEDAIAEADILRSIISKLTQEVKAKEGQLEKTGRDMAATLKTYMERTERADASKENATAVAIMLQAIPSCKTNVL